MIERLVDVCDEILIFLFIKMFPVWWLLLALVFMGVLVVTVVAGGYTMYLELTS